MKWAIAAVLIAATAVWTTIAVKAATSSSYPNVVFTDGFESGSLSAWDGKTGTGAAAVSSAAAHSGSNGVRLTNASGQTVYVQKTLSKAYVDTSVRFWARVSANATGTLTLAQATDATSSRTMWKIVY